MNERIRELAEQAWQYANNNSRDGDGTHGCLYRDKFAELIVLECLDIVANADMTGSWITHPKDVLYVACDQVKNHFGVQE
jgi:hypothetical protein